MIFRSLDENGDICFGKGRNNFARDDDAISLDIETRIKSWVGDCFFAQTEGIDWLNRLGSKNQEVLLEQDLRLIILQSFGVVGIVEIYSEVNGRNFTVNYTINTINSKDYKNTVEG